MTGSAALWTSVSYVPRRTCSTDESCRNSILSNLYYWYVTVRAVLIVVSLPALFAQPSAQVSNKDPWADLRAKNPPGLELSLRLTAQHPYHRGELIPVEATAHSMASNPGQAPVQEIWQFSGFLLDPAVDCGSLQKPCFGHYGPFSGNRPEMGIGQRTGPTSLFLNGFLPLLQPGRYRAAMLLRKEVLLNSAALSRTFGYADPPQYAVTSPVEFDVIPSSGLWIQQTIAGAIATLKNADPQAYESRRTASEQLRFLGTSDAWRAGATLLPLDETTMLQGLAASNQPAWVCNLLQARMSAPDQSVSSGYFSTMVQVCTQVQVPPPPLPVTPMRPVQAVIATTPPVATAVTQRSPEMLAYLEKAGTYRDALVKRSAAALAASLPQKQPEPLAAAFSTLLDQIQQSRNARPPQPAPEWAGGLTREFVRSANRLSGPLHDQLLNYFASTFHSPELIPLLESVLDGWKPGHYYEAPRGALISLYRIDRPRAQARIIKELLQPSTRLDTSLLNLLPASAVPPMDDDLIEALARAQRPGGWNSQLVMAALAKYGTPEAAARLKAIYESQQQKCQPELMAYFVRTEPDYADRVFHSHSWDMQVDPPQCTVGYFQRTAPLAMGPGLEGYMAAYLMHANVRVKTVTAQMLGLYGSKSAAEPLWNAFRYFHEYWKDKRAELPPNGEGAQLEVALRNAIARGHNWLANAADLHQMESVCISEQCMYETQQDLRAWQQMPLRLELSNQGGDVRATVAQYYGLGSMEALEEKLAQFPRGTSFLVSTSGEDAAQALAAIRQLAERQGLILTDSR